MCSVHNSIYMNSSFDPELTVDGSTSRWGSSGSAIPPWRADCRGRKCAQMRRSKGRPSVGRAKPGFGLRLPDRCELVLG